MKRAILLVTIICQTLYLSANGQEKLQLTINNAKDLKPISGVTVLDSNDQVIGRTNNAGIIYLPDKYANKMIKIKHIGYERQEITITENNRTISLIPVPTIIEEVVINTGYQKIPIDRSAGSFTIVEQKDLERTVANNLIAQLEDIVPGLQFDRRQSDGSNTSNGLALRLRGISTINSDSSPLIVLDHFPYEGSIEDINPNDVESVSFLKDATAASIWGARAANGVIVITSKNGKPNTSQINYSSTFKQISVPDLYYDRAFIPSPEFIELETWLFNQNYYNTRENSNAKTVLSPAIELLIKKRDNPLLANEVDNQLAEMVKYDIRRQMMDHWYRRGNWGQHFASISKGNHYFSAGHDHTQSSHISEYSKRYTLTARNSFQLFPNVNFSSAISWSNSTDNRSGLNLGIQNYPYNTLLDDNGNPAEIFASYRDSYKKQQMAAGLLDWVYKPLEELDRNSTKGTNSQLLANLNLKANLYKGLTADLMYRYTIIDGEERLEYLPESYYIRNLVNRYTQADGTQVFPYNGQLRLTQNNTKGNEIRAQLSYNNTISSSIELSGIVGFERRELIGQNSVSSFYDYDRTKLSFNNQYDYTTRYPVRPTGTALLSTPPAELNKTVDRYLSYYANGSLLYNNLYTLTGSIRWDGSNLFGVKTNQKGVPLWSIGAAVKLSDLLSVRPIWLNNLKVRASYGFNGNVNTNASSFMAGFYGQNADSQTTYVDIRNPGNPQLKWEKVAVWNTALDFSLLNHRIYGSIDLYQKNAQDLLGQLTTDPTNGFIMTTAQFNNLINYANMKVNGMDLHLISINTEGRFNWSTQYIVGTVSNKVTKYNAEQFTGNNLQGILGLPLSGKIVQEGASYDALYRLPWHGLNPENGNPLILLENEKSEDYTAYVNQLSVEQLLSDKYQVPTFYGSIRNTLSYANLELSFNISWKAGYSFLRSTVVYNTLYASNTMHIDYINRWQNSGDESGTDIPSRPLPSNSNITRRDFVYRASDALTENGAHIRLRDIRLAYQFNPMIKKHSLRTSLFIYTDNLGLLWRANKSNIDPDYPSSSITPPATLSIGCRLTL